MSGAMTAKARPSHGVIEVARARCEGYGFCEETAPELFRLDDDGELEVLLQEVPPELVTAAENAVRACPVAALRLKAASGQPLREED